MEDRRFHWYARDLYGFCTRCESSRTLSVEKRHFEQSPRVDRPPPALCRATLSEVGAFYWTVLAPDIVNSGREEQGSVSV
jgi:hypothetical protein